MDILGSALGAIFGGGATGLFGSFMSGWLELKKQKLQNEHESQMAEHELAVMDKETERQVSISRIEADAQIQVADAQLMSASYDADQLRYSKPGNSWMMQFVDFVRGLIRPVLTAYLVWVASRILAAVLELLDKMDGLSEALLVPMANQVIMAVLYMAMTALGWWFGTRGKMFQK